MLGSDGSPRRVGATVLAFFFIDYFYFSFLVERLYSNQTTPAVWFDIFSLGCSHRCTVQSGTGTSYRLFIGYHDTGFFSPGGTSAYLGSECPVRKLLASLHLALFSVTAVYASRSGFAFQHFSKNELI
jgi:hypothetical protein